MVHEGQASRFLCSPVGCPVRLISCLGWHLAVEVADMGRFDSGASSWAEEGVVVDRIADFAGKL